MVLRGLELQQNEGLHQLVDSLQHRFHIEALKKVKQCGFDETELLAEGPLWDSSLAPAIEIFKQTLNQKGFKKT